MKKAKILQNPTAGNESYTKEDLENILAENGYACEYASVKERHWKDVGPDTDFIVVAGGDGTVKKVIAQLLIPMEEKKRLPLVLIPAGTANNIATSLGIGGSAGQIIAHFSQGSKKKYDTGTIQGLDHYAIFIESVGTGIFPELMKQMENKSQKKDASPEEKIKTAQRTLQAIVMNHPATELSVTIDGKGYSGRYLMAEIMNIQSLGPHLMLAPLADTGDGYFDVVLVGEDQRQDLADHVSLTIAGIKRRFEPTVIRGKQIALTGTGLSLHVDDELVADAADIHLRIAPGEAVEYML